MLTASAEVRISDHSFGLFDHFEIPIETASWSTGLIVEMTSGAMIYTGIDRGTVHVTAHILSTAPDLADRTLWDEIAEASVHAPHGELLIQQLEYGPAESLPRFPPLSSAGPGTYRLRARARGRDLHFDKVRDDSGEEYLLEIWPAPPQPSLVIRATDHCGYGLRLANLTRPHHRPAAPPPATPPPAPPATPSSAPPATQRHDPLRQALLDAAEHRPDH